MWKISDFPQIFSSVAVEEYLKSKHNSNLSLTAWKGENDRNYLLLSSSFFIIWQRMWPFRWLYGVNMKKFSSHIFIQSTIFKKGEPQKFMHPKKTATSGNRMSCGVLNSPQEKKLSSSLLLMLLYRVALTK